MDNSELYKNKVVWDTMKKIFVSNSADEKDEKTLKSIYGTEIVNPVRFDSGYHYFKPHAAKRQNPANEYFMNKSFQDFHNNIIQSGIMEKKYMDNFTLPPTTICHFYRSKNIIKTDMLMSYYGTKKEFYGFDDWQITIQIVCIQEVDKTPQQARDLIIDWAMLLDKIHITSDIFNRKKIFAIVIEDIDIKTIKGSPNVIPIELRCISTEPDLLFLNSQVKEQFFNNKKMQDFDKRMKDTDFNNFPL